MAQREYGIDGEAEISNEADSLSMVEGLVTVVDTLDKEEVEAVVVKEDDEEEEDNEEEPESVVVSVFSSSNGT